MVLVQVNRDPTPGQVRQFALLWLPAFLWLLAGWAVWRFEAPRVAAALAVGGLASVVLGLTAPRATRGLFIAWTLAAFPIGWVVSHLLMGIIYFLVITPIALVMRLAGRDPLQRRFDRTAESYWTPREQELDSARYFRQF